MRVDVDFTVFTDGVTTMHHQGPAILEESRLKFPDENHALHSFSWEFQDVLRFDRGGNEPLSMSFRLKKDTEAQLTAEGNTYRFTVHTTVFLLSSDRIDLTYHVTDGNTILSKHRIRVVWTS